MALSIPAIIALKGRVIKLDYKPTEIAVRNSNHFGWIATEHTARNVVAELEDVAAAFFTKSGNQIVVLENRENEAAA